MSETQVVNAIINLIDQLGGVAFRYNSGTAIIPSEETVFEGLEAVAQNGWNGNGY